jgi:hypothetical protein
VEWEGGGMCSVGIMTVSLERGQERETDWLSCSGSVRCGPRECSYVVRRD